jgi:hypothetical protein
MQRFVLSLDLIVQYSSEATFDQDRTRDLSLRSVYQVDCRCFNIEIWYRKKERSQPNESF